MVNSAKKSLEAMVYEDIDMNLIQDGTYSGETDAGLEECLMSIPMKAGCHYWRYSVRNAIYPIKEAL